MSFVCKNINLLAQIFNMATAPNCRKNAEQARLRRAHHLEHNKEEDKWAKTLTSYKYPHCIGKKIFEDCPEELKDIKNPPSACRSCPQYTPSLEDHKKKMQEIMELMKK